jgi:biopolymer transport protein ExbB
MAGISFLQLLKNSWAIDLLLIFSVIALAVILERLWSYSRLGIDEKALLNRVQSAFKRGNIQEASFICKSVNHPLGEILDVGIRNKDLPREDIADLIDGALIETKSYLERKNSVLSTISFISPLLGLLGTVMGIIRAFHDLSVSGSGGPSVVMAGVAEALVSTAIGIIVAIPAAIFYNYFMNKVKTILTKIEANSRRFLAFLHTTSTTKGKKETLELD